MDMPGIKVIEMNARDNLNEENRKKNKSAGRKEEYEKGCPESKEGSRMRVARISWFQ